jgi:hypothetical protein
MGKLQLRAEALAWRRVEDEVIAVDLRSSTYLSASGSAALLWQALAGGTTRDMLIDLLTGEFGVERDRAAADVDAFVADLAGRELLDEAAA